MPDQGAWTGSYEGKDVFQEDPKQSLERIGVKG